MKRKWLAALAIFALATAPAVAEPLVETLDNGLISVVKENHTAPVASFRIYVKTGSMYEGEYLGAGISHIFEHLISGGTTSNRSEAEIKETVERLGNVNNAYTTTDHTCYYIQTSSDRVGEAIDLMADWMKNCTFPQAEYEREMGVVLEELYKGREEPNRILYQAFISTLYRQHPVRHPVIGYEPQLKRLTRDDIVKYYHDHYVPNNMIVVCVGDFDARTIQQRIRQAFTAGEGEDFSRRALPPKVLPQEPPQLGRRDRVIEKDGLGGASFRVAFHTVPLQHPDLYALDVLSYILSEGRSSRLVRQVVEKQRLATSIGTWSSTPHWGGGFFLLYGDSAPEQVDAAIDAGLAELYRCREELVDQEELAKAKRQMIAQDVLRRQTADDEAKELGSNVMGTGNPHFSQLYLQGIRQVTAEQVREVAGKYFREDAMTRVILRPPAKAEAAAAGPDAPGRDALRIHRYELPNGLRLLVRPNPAVPAVNLQVSFLGGVRLEPAGQAGVSNLTAAMLTRGTAERSAEQIAATFDGIGGSLGGNSGNNSLSLNCEVLKEDFDTALAVFADILQHAEFPAEEFRTVQQKTLQAIARQDDRWDGQLVRLFRAEYFAEHPYGRSRLGTEESVKGLSPKDLQEFYRRHVVPARGVMTVFGDVDPEAVREQVAKALANWDRAAPDLPEVPVQPPPSKDLVREIPVPRGLSGVMIGYPGRRITDTDDGYALLLLDGVLSGVGYPGGRLHNALRGGDQDLVYLVHAWNFPGLAQPGFFGVMAASTPPKSDQVVAIIRREIQRVKDEPVSAEELEKAKAMAITSESLSRQTNASVALQTALDELYGLGYDHSQEFAERIAAVTVEDVQRVARKYLTHSVMVRTGPGGEQKQN